MQSPIRVIDNLLNKVTMYQLLVYGLSVILMTTIVLSGLHVLPQSMSAIIASAVVLMIVCYVTNKLWGALWSASTNHESWLITALILTLIVPPGQLGVHHLFLIAAVGLVAMASKYILVCRRHHLFNPAAIAVLLLGLANIIPATWWIGQPVMLFATTPYGLLVARKLRHFQVVGSFLLAALFVALVIGLHQSLSLNSIMHTAILSSPLIFFATIMLTEPETLPAANWQQLSYAALIGLIYSSQFHFGRVTATPELALIVGNVFSAVVSPKKTMLLQLKSITELSPRTYEAIFSHDSPLQFQPGQYITLNLQHQHADARGTRRTFSIASAPGNNELTVVFKTPFKGKTSSFKQALLGLKPGSSITGTSIAGTFTLPTAPQQKVAFIAGGVGITPFLSMLRQQTSDNTQTRDVILLHFVRDETEADFSEVREAASKHGAQAFSVYDIQSSKTSGGTLSGQPTIEDLQKAIPSFKERVYYISGPPTFVDNYKALLAKASIPYNNIRTDHFAGY